MQFDVKLRSYVLSFHEFRPRFVLFPMVGTGRIDVARRLVSASVVSRVMAVNCSHFKGKGSGQTASMHPFTRALPRYLQNMNGATVRIPLSTSTNLQRLEVWSSHTSSEQGLTDTNF
ncbi:hypothetical protein AVEN_37493-1 [Araneus ventricosus]|uniref:Uncharacterized protein n=1 Tax=Araneus ventricosus TaxID=182803 RepID=A0A4Y2J9F9_ARAVE|nr:hypothetical protein AVEN_37493-1 [Araneus ventricosus]